MFKIQWYDQVTNAAVVERTHLKNIKPINRDDQLALFSHIVSMKHGVPAPDTLTICLDIRIGRSPDKIWLRPCSRARITWVDEIISAIGVLDLQVAWLLVIYKIVWRAFVTSRDHLTSKEEDRVQERLM